MLFFFFKKLGNLKFQSCLSQTAILFPSGFLCSLVSRYLNPSYWYRSASSFNYSAECILNQSIGLLKCQRPAPGGRRGSISPCLLFNSCSEHSTFTHRLIFKSTLPSLYCFLEFTLETSVTLTPYQPLLIAHAALLNGLANT